MKNIQIIDGARNSIFEVYQVSNALFEQIFPNETDIAFIDEVEKKFKQIGRSRDLWAMVYRRKIDKKQSRGIHGTLHLTGSCCSKKYFPTRKEAEVNNGKV